MKANRNIELPGEERGAKDGVTALNNTNKNPNDIAREREATLRGMAIATATAAGETPDLAPEVAADDKPSIKRKTVMGGEEVEVEVPKSRVNQQVQKFGPESRLPKGTRVKEDGTPCNDGEEPFGVIGDIRTQDGILVNRVIPSELLDGAS